jgi:DNA polymerase V
MRVFALADCNSFYCSCERVFQPELRGKPVVVLSNNDGCCIAMSDEAKAVGIEMATPVFMVQKLIEKHDVQIRSSNYTLYADMSDRVMTILREAVPSAEVYSIDEAFLDLTGVENVEEFCRDLRERVRKWTGIPISIGIGPTKVLAKLANKLAKKGDGVRNLMPPGSAAEAMKGFPVEKIWGIGRAHSTYLRGRGITTAMELALTDTASIRKKMGVVGERLVHELRGVSCLSINEVTPARKNIVCAKSFGRPLETLPEVEAALAEHVCRVGAKLREEKNVAGIVSVFLLTNSFNPTEPQYCPSASAALPEPTSSNMIILRVAGRLLRAMFKTGYRFKKIGVMLDGISPDDTWQPALIGGDHIRERRNRLQAAVDRVNAAHGRDTVRPAMMGFGDEFVIQASMKSRCYTTDWRQLPIAKAS